MKGTAGPVINQSFELAQSLLIGSSPSCDIQLQSARAAEVVEVTLDTEGVRLRVLDDATLVSVNGESASGQLLQVGDEIRIGACAFLLQAPGMRPQRMLTEDALRPSRGSWPWLLAAATLAAGLLTWQLGVLPF